MIPCHVFDSLIPALFYNYCFGDLIIHQVDKWNNQKHHNGINVILMINSQTVEGWGHCRYDCSEQLIQTAIKAKLQRDHCSRVSIFIVLLSQDTFQKAVIRIPAEK